MSVEYKDVKQELFHAAADIPNRTHPNSVSMNEIASCHSIEFQLQKMLHMSSIIVYGSCDTQWCKRGIGPVSLASSNL